MADHTMGTKELVQPECVSALCADVFMQPLTQLLLNEGKTLRP